MKKITLYCYYREDGGLTVSPEKPDVEYTESNRLIADDGFILFNGTDYAPCIDTDTPDEWSEVIGGDPEDEIDDDEALNILMGGSV